MTDGFMTEYNKPAIREQKMQQLRSHRAASRFFEAAGEDVHVLNRVGLSIGNMVQHMSSSDSVGGPDSFAACYNLVLEALLDERVLSRELSEFVATAGRAVISHSLDVSLPCATSEEFNEYISILHRQAHSPESLAREVLSGNDGQKAIAYNITLIQRNSCMHARTGGGTFQRY